MIEDTALNFSEHSEEYKAMMDNMVERDKNGTLIIHSLKEILKQYGR